MSGVLHLWIGSLTGEERSGRPAWDPFHGQRNAPAWNVDLQDGYSDLLVDLYDRIGIADKSIGELTDMDEAILMHPDIDKGSKGRDIGDHTGKDHAGDI